MNNPGGVADDPFDLLVRARTVLLDALEALAEHRDAVIVIGAQAVYLRTGGLDIALAEATKDSDVALDPRTLGPDPKIEEAMKKAHFYPSNKRQPGSWVNAEGIPVDLMVPEHLAGKGGTRSVRIPPHDKMVARRTRGLEAAVVDYSEMLVPPLTPGDNRIITANVAGPAALLVAKCHKIAERVEGPNPDRLQDKDAHDVYRILAKFETAALASTFANLLADEVSAKTTEEAVTYLQTLFANGADSIGSMMAGRAEEGVGEPEQVSTAISFLASDLVEAIRR
jgi:hypothetical protein